MPKVSLAPAPFAGSLENEASDELACPRPARDACRLLKAEARSEGSTGRAGARGAACARQEAGCRRQRSRRTWGGKYGAVKDVHELRPNAEVYRLVDPELASHAEVLRGMPLGPVVAVIRRRSAKRARSRTCPRSRIQHQGFGRIEAVAVEILKKQRL